MPPTSEDSLRNFPAASFQGAMRVSGVLASVAGRRGISRFLAAALLSLLLFPVAIVPQAGAGEANHEAKLRLFGVINEDRHGAGLNPLKFSEELSRLADEHCREMLREGYTSHWNRAGWKPYVRYAASGLGAYTEENISAVWETAFASSADNLWENLLSEHQAFMAERPPDDGHRRSILNPRNELVGIGVASDNHGMRMIEVFGLRDAALDPLPLRARLSDTLVIRGRILNSHLALESVSVFYEPLPRPMSLAELRAASGYSLPDQENIERPHIAHGMYTDGTTGNVRVEEDGQFSVPLRFWKQRPGVYSVAVWLRPGGESAYIGALAPILVDSP